MGKRHYQNVIPFWDFTEAVHGNSDGGNQNLQIIFAPNCNQITFTTSNRLMLSLFATGCLTCCSTVSEH